MRKCIVYFQLFTKEENTFYISSIYSSFHSLKISIYYVYMVEKADMRSEGKALNTKKLVKRSWGGALIHRKPEMDSNFIKVEVAPFLCHFLKKTSKKYQRRGILAEHIMIPHQVFPRLKKFCRWQKVPRMLSVPMIYREEDMSVGCLDRVAMILKDETWNRPFTVLLSDTYPKYLFCSLWRGFKIPIFPSSIN